jgi:succinate-acetate transporter protein
VHFGSPVLTAGGVVVALVLGVGGLATLLAGIWVALTGKSLAASVGR